MAGQELSHEAVKEGMHSDLKEREDLDDGAIYPSWNWSLIVSHELQRGMSLQDFNLC